jgi:hypothetical protein
MAIGRQMYEVCFKLSELRCCGKVTLGEGVVSVLLKSLYKFKVPSNGPSTEWLVTKL